MKHSISYLLLFIRKEWEEGYIGKLEKEVKIKRERKMGLGINTRNGQGPHVTCRSFLSSCISFKLIEYLFLINCFLPFL
jgi:hypothetical protein